MTMRKKTGEKRPEDEIEKKFRRFELISFYVISFLLIVGVSLYIRFTGFYDFDLGYHDEEGVWKRDLWKRIYDGLVFIIPIACAITTWFLFETGDEMAENFFYRWEKRKARKKGEKG